MYLNILELNWYQQFEDNKKILRICHHMLTSSTQLQNRSFQVMERTRIAVKCTKMRICMSQDYCFPLSNMQICDVLVAIVVVLA